MMAACSEYKSKIQTEQQKLLDMTLKNMVTELREIKEQMKQMNGHRVKHHERLASLEAKREKDEAIEKALERERERHNTKTGLKFQSWQAIGGGMAILAVLVALFSWLWDILRTALFN